MNPGPRRGRPREPLLWALFSTGGMLAALFLPALVAVLFVAVPAGWLPTMPHDALAGLILHPVTRVLLFLLVMVCLFHGAHRFRFTLYDGMQLYHLNPLIAFLTYGMAVVLSAATAVMLWIAG